MGKNISAPDIWHKLIKRFNEAKLQYVLVGGAALVIHGLPRTTLDIDIYVSAKEEVLNKLFQITDSLGLQSKQKAMLGISHSPKLLVNQWLSFSYKGQDVVDVFLDSEDEFDRLYKNSERKHDKSLSVRVASLKDIKTMKQDSGRPIDIADIKVIEEIKK